MKKSKNNKRVKKLPILHRVLKSSHMYEIVGGFLLFYFIMTAVIYFTSRGEGVSNINNFGDAMWFTFASAFTIGYGDVWMSGALGRVLTVFIVIYATIIIGLLPGVFSIYFNELFKARAGDITSNKIMADLGNLEKLSKEELHALSEKLKKIKKDHHL